MAGADPAGQREEAAPRERKEMREMQRRDGARKRIRGKQPPAEAKVFASGTSVEITRPAAERGSNQLDDPECFADFPEEGEEEAQAPWTEPPCEEEVPEEGPPEEIAPIDLPHWSALTRAEIEKAELDEKATGGQAWRLWARNSFENGASRAHRWTKLPVE